MDLFASHGRPTTLPPLELDLVRPLANQDLAEAKGRSAGATVPVLQKVRSVHHKQAALLASGLTAVEVAAATGATSARIGQLLKDPTFMELLAYYQDQAMAKLLNESERIKTKLLRATEDALDEINDRLEDDTKRQAMPVGELRKIVEMGGDRTVAPPKATAPSVIPPTQITLNFGSPVGVQAQDPSRGQGPVIEHQPESVPLPSPEEEK